MTCCPSTSSPTWERADVRCSTTPSSCAGASPSAHRAARRGPPYDERSGSRPPPAAWRPPTRSPSSTTPTSSAARFEAPRCWRAGTRAGHAQAGDEEAQPRRGVRRRAGAGHAADGRRRHRDRPPGDGLDGAAAIREVVRSRRSPPCAGCGLAHGASRLTSRRRHLIERRSRRGRAGEAVGRLTTVRPCSTLIRSSDRPQAEEGEEQIRRATRPIPGPPPPQQQEGSSSSHHVRAIHRTRPPGGRPRPGGGAHAQAQLHRHGAHPARPPARGGGAGRACARVPRHHRRARARAGRAHRRLR